MDARQTDAGAGSPGREPERRLTTGRLSLELVATVRSRFGDLPQDDLGDGAELARWLAKLGIATSEPVTARDVDGFRSVREAIYRLVAQACGDAAADPRAGADVALINRLARGDVPTAQVRLERTDGGRTVFASGTPSPSPAQTVSMFARDAIELLTGPYAHRVHQCEGGACGTFFVDTSRGGRRRWCLSSTCGNRARVGAYRSRRSRASEPQSSR